jgi:RNA polymerase I-specific transcription initiation factor RRN6
MWPQKEGLGVRLSYGVDGNGVIRHRRPDEDLSGPWECSLEFARLDDESALLYKTSAPPRVLVPAQSSEFNVNCKAYNDLENVSVSQEILKSYLVESRSLTSAISYDPTVGPLFEFHHLRMKRGLRYSPVLAYVSGESGTILNVSVASRSGRDCDRLGPHLWAPFQVALSEPIKQIHFSKLSETFDFIPPYLLVRTDYNVYVLNCRRTTDQPSSRELGIELTLIDQLSTKDLEGESFADVQFNPRNHSQFAVVDRKGHFAVWDISVSKKNANQLTLACMDTSTIPDQSELSSWNKVVWANDYKLVFVITRSSLWLMDIPNRDKAHKLATADTWSRFLDLQRCGQFMFLLTSKELIWLQHASDDLNRLMSWKHFLDDTDPSMKVHVSESRDRFTCIIYSQVVLLVFVYTFEWRLGTTPVSLHDPYYLRASTGLLQLGLLRLDDSLYNPMGADTEDDGNEHYALMALKTDLSLTLSLLSEEPLVEDALVGDIRSTPTLEIPLMPTKHAEPFTKLTKAEVLAILNKVKAEVSLITEPTIAAVQDYAFELGKGVTAIKSNHLSLLSLYDVSPNVPEQIEDVSEFDTMIEQLANYYEQEGVTTFNFIKVWLSFRQDDAAAQTVSDIKSKLCRTYLDSPVKTFNSESRLKQSAMLLGASLIKTSSTIGGEQRNAHSQKLEAQMQSAPPLIQSLLGKWSEPSEEDSRHVAATSQVTDADPYASSMPTLNLSSQLGSTAHKRRRRDRPRLAALSQTAHSQPYTSQVLSSQLTLSSYSGTQPSQTAVAPISQTIASSQLTLSQSRRTLGSLKKKKKKRGFA